jgi:hypothetical protein
VDFPSSLEVLSSFDDFTMCIARQEWQAGQYPNGRLGLVWDIPKLKALQVTKCM